MEQENKEAFNKNEKQLTFNQIKGVITAIDTTGEWGSLLLSVGHEKKRPVCLTLHQRDYAKIVGRFTTGDFVTIKFFLTSREKDGRWHTSANVLEVLTED